MLKAPIDLGRRRVKTRLQARHVELGCRQDGTQFVVQFAGEQRALLLADALKVSRQVAEVSGAGFPLRLDRIAFGCHPVGSSING